MPTKEIGPAKARHACGKDAGEHDQRNAEHLDVHAHALGIGFAQLVRADGLAHQEHGDGW